MITLLPHYVNGAANHSKLLLNKIWENVIVEINFRMICRKEETHETRLMKLMKE